MKKKLLCFMLILFMIFGYSVQTLPNKVYAEVGESFYSVEKIANEDSSNVQIQLNVGEDIIVNQVVYPDESMTVEDLTQYTYSVDQNDTYAFTISYTDSKTQKVKEEKVTVEVTEIVEPQVDDQEESVPETAVQQQTTVEETTPTQKADVVSKAVESNSLDVVYVSGTGNDETGAGTQESPVATLSKAVDVVKDDGTIYVMSDLIMTKCARYYGKNLTMTSGDGGPYTLTRGDNFEKQQDNARSTYNPALIEVDSTEGAGTASLTLTNIILDDAGKKEGSYFVQADSEGGSTTVGGEEVQNSNIVQDAMIATYNGVGTITLGDGAVLKNFGGMSAIRMAGGTLNMQLGSKIIDDSVIDRTKGTVIQGSDKSYYGPAGAIWSQGGTINVESGAYIGGADENTMMHGRAIYLDDGTVNVNGTIQYITADADMWYGRNGAAIHVRNNGQAILGATGVIDSVLSDVHGGYTGAVVTNGSRGNGYDFETKKGSVIRNITGFPTLFSNYGTELLNGIIENCTNDYIIGGFAQNTHIGETGLIHKCVASKGDAKAIVYTSNASKIYMNGTIKDNDASYGFYIINQSGGGASLEMNDGAVLLGKGTNTGVYVNASGSSFTMNGGTIGRFSTGVQCRGKFRDNRSSPATFIMNGGTICENKSQGLYFNVESNSQSIVNLNGGIIENNGSNEISAASGKAEDKFERIKINKGVVKGSRLVRMSMGTLTLSEEYADVQLGNAKTDAVDKIKELVENDNQYKGWKVVGSSALWIKPSTSEYEFQISRSYSAKNTGLFVTYIPLLEDGTPLDDVRLMAMEEVENADTIDVSLKGLTPNTSYAVMFVNNDEYTLDPDDITIYTGGGQGDEIYDDGFPEITINNSIDKSYVKNTETGKYGYDLESLEVKGKSYTATAEKSLVDQLTELLDVTYTDLNGNPVEDDSKAGEYIAKLSWKDGLTDEDVKVNKNEVVLGDGGKVIVRHIKDIEETQKGETTHELLTEEPTAQVEHIEVIAKMGGYNGNSKPDFYINDDENRVADTVGIQILDDGLLTSEDDNRQELMEEKAIKELGLSTEKGVLNSFDFHYLDLVDAYNGNAWVSAEYGTTVYMPYPEGLNKTKAEELELNVVHYKDLHREYGIAGQKNVEEAIKNCELEVMENVIFEEDYIQFDVPRSGFSPFALVWSEHTGTGTVTINYKDADTGEELRKPYVETVTNGEDYDVSQSASKLGLKGFHIDRVDGIENEVGTMQDDVTITVWYKNDAPVIKADDVTIHVGDEFDPYDYVEVSDREWNVNDWGNIIDNLKVESNVDVNKAGVYTVTYSITDCTVDNRGTKTTTKTIKVTVLDDSDPIKPTDPTDPVNPGDNNKPTDDSKDSDIVTDVKPDKPTETKTDKTTESTEVKTGDSSPIMIYALGAGISLVAIAYMITKRHRDM